MKQLIKRYQYWWYSGEGYSLEEFDKPEELLDLISRYSTNQFYITERCNYLPSMDFSVKEGL
jgi:hypothetical protein